MVISGEQTLVMSGEEKNCSQKITFGLVLKLKIPKGNVGEHW